MAAALIVGGCANSTEEPAETTATVSPTTTVSTATTLDPPTTTADTTTTTTAAEFEPRFGTGDLFEFDSPSLAIPNGPDLAWDWRYTDPGAVHVDGDGVIHVFQNGFAAWPAPVGVGYWRSEDGQSFEEISDDPVFDGTDLEYVGRAALASSMIVEPDGTWVLYFYVWDGAGWPVSAGTIGRATAPSPTGPWTADESPVLTPGDGEEWDSLYVRTPSVIRTDDGYTMFYGAGTRDTAMIGMATSADGKNWQKHDDPTTTEAPFADSDPVLVPGDPREGNVWDQRSVYQPRVVEIDGSYVMSYASSTTMTDPFRLVRKIGLAVSNDGLSWQRSLGAVISTGTLNADAFWFTELARRNDELLLFVEVARNGETDVHLARASVDDVLEVLDG